MVTGRSFGPMVLLHGLLPLLASAVLMAGSVSPVCAQVVVSRTPASGARWVSPASGILVRLERPSTFAAAAYASGFRVCGERSGEHALVTRLLDRGRLVSFTIVGAFAPAERVDVTATGSFANLVPATGWSFTVSPGRRALPPSDDGDPLGRHQTGADRLQGGAPLPQAVTTDPPAIMTYRTALAAPGALYIAPFRFAGADLPARLVTDDAGGALFFAPEPAPCYDFKVQPDNRLSWFDSVVGGWIVATADEQPVDTLLCGNGYSTDVHELRLLPDGHALLMSYDAEPVDMSHIVAAGDPDATVIGLVIQELDAEKNVVFEWRSWDHFEITDAVGIDLTAHTVDYCHGNAIEVDADGNLLLSSRHMDEITKIDRQTGDVIWRWGGLHNQFAFLGDPLAFSHQHAIRRLPNGHYTLFDNGNLHSPPFSRALEYVLDQNARTAQAVWSYCGPGGIFSIAMGYVQRLENGNTLIGWGASSPAITEVTPDGTKAFEMTLAPGVFSYRAYRQTAIPYLDAGSEPRSGALQLSCTSSLPARGRLDLTFSLPRAGRTDLELFDVSGRVIAQILQGEPLTAGRHEAAVDLSRLMPGLYLARLRVQEPGRPEIVRSLKAVVAR